MVKITKEKITACLKGSGLTLATLMGVIGGVVFGICLKQRASKGLMCSGGGAEITQHDFPSTPRKPSKLQQSLNQMTLFNVVNAN